MNFLDKNKDESFSAEEIYEVFKTSMNKQNIYRCMKIISRREEYKTSMIKINRLHGVKVVMVYQRGN